MPEVSMPDKKQLFTVSYSITNYKEASNLIIEKATTHSSFGVSALAVHGLIETVKDTEFRRLMQKMDLIVPDGQPVKWALNSFYKAGLKERVAGPELTKHILKKANEKRLGIYLYCSTAITLEKFRSFIEENYPSVIICGTHEDRFRDATPAEDIEDIQKINNSGAHIVLVGRGCPRQEKWVTDHLGKIHAVMIAVGAAFDFHAGNIRIAPKWMQQSGLEWLYRLIQQPKKLWTRYLTTNSHFIYLFIICKLGFKKIAFN
jgi:exopolysaccharide biosynthesis WecB/TagA/CpsF family protein